MPDDIEISRPYERALGPLGDEHRSAGTGASLLAGCLIGHIFLIGHIEEQGYTQTQAAKAFGEQPHHVQFPGSGCRLIRP